MSFSPAHNQLAMYYVLHPDKLVRQFSQPFCHSLNSNYLKTIVVIQMKMLGRENHIVILMLDIIRFSGDTALMMVVKQYNRTLDNIITLPFLHHQVLFNQMPYSTGTVWQTVFDHIVVQCFKKILIETYTKTCQRHRVIFLLIRVTNLISFTKAQYNVA